MHLDARLQNLLCLRFCPTFPGREKGRLLVPGIVSLGMATLFFSMSCGYRLSSARKDPPAGIQSLGIPTFVNNTHSYKIEQLITAAVLKEFSARTRIPVNSRTSGVDAVLFGEIRNVSSSPVTFGSDTFGSAFLVTVEISAKLVRIEDGSVLWEDEGFLYRERYVLNSKTTDFFSEQTPALERLSNEFAASLASTILNR